MNLNEWMDEYDLPKGQLSYEYADHETGQQVAVFDIAWPNGVQENLSEPVVVLLNEGEEIIALASKAGYRCFTSTEEFKKYVASEILTDVEINFENNLSEEIHNEEGIYNREYWENRVPDRIVFIFDELMKMVNEYAPNYKMNYNKYHIGLIKNNSVNNFISFNPRKKFVRLNLRRIKDKILEEDMLGKGIDMSYYDKRAEKYRIKITENMLIELKDFIRKLIEDTVKENI